ncbi:F-box/FBD/LRR-repeat protein-like protein [Tanacetum coccineum]
MEQVHGTYKASKFEPQYFISSVPENVMANIMNRLPIQDAVRTGILSRNWRFNWTLLNQLVLDCEFIENLLERDRQGNHVLRILSRLFYHLKGPITKFTLDFTEKVMDAEDINHWVLFLSSKGIKELTLNNIFSLVLHKLPTHLYSCMELKHLKLSRCSFHLSHGFRGFPNLLSLELATVSFESFRCWEFIARCPLLEILDFHNLDNMNEEILVEISKLENLKSLSWNLVRTITNSSIFLLMLTGHSKLQTLDINCNYDEDVPQPVTLDPSKMGQLQLREVLFGHFAGSANEVCFIKYILACSPLLKKMVVLVNQTFVMSHSGYGRIKIAWELSRKLLKLQRASPTAEIVLY